MATWLLKTEPGTYCFADLLRDKKTVWDGIRNHAAKNHLRSTQKGDLVLVYHTGTRGVPPGLPSTWPRSGPSSSR